MSSFVPDPLVSGDPVSGSPEASSAGDTADGASVPDSVSPEPPPAGDTAEGGAEGDPTMDQTRVSAADAPSEAPDAPAALVDHSLEGAEPIDHEQALNLDLAELEAKAEKADEYLDLARRTRADFDNFRKRAAREAAAAQERGVMKLARELLPAIDNLDRAMAAAQQAGDGADATLSEGVKLVHAELLGALARAGIEPFSPAGEQFDPQRHEAMAQMPVEGAAPGTIVEVYQSGYALGETILRPARVVVAG